MKTMSILNLFFSVVFIILILIFSSDERYDASSFIAIVYGLWALAFSVVSIVNSFKKNN